VLSVNSKGDNRGNEGVPGHFYVLLVRGKARGVKKNPHQELDSSRKNGLAQPMGGNEGMEMGVGWTITFRDGCRHLREK